MSEQESFQEMNSSLFEEMEAAILAVLDLDTDDFITIAESQGLDPKRDFAGTNLKDVDLSGANLSGANLSGANLSGANLSGANLSRANLSRANLSRANLSRANLNKAELKDTNLTGSSLSGADLSGADLSGAELTGANLSRTIFDTIHKNLAGNINDPLTSGNINDSLTVLEMTLRQLRKVASRVGMSRYSRMKKDELLAAIQYASETETGTAQDITSQPPQSNRDALPNQERVEAAKFELGSEESIVALASVDEGLADLPEGYGESRIVLMPLNPQEAFVYWDVPNNYKEELRRQGGQQMALRLCDATDIDLNTQAPQSIQEYPCDELAREWYVPIPMSDRDYAIEIGYRCGDGRWLILCRSAAVRVSSTYLSGWIEEWDPFEEDEVPMPRIHHETYNSSPIIQDPNIKHRRFM